MKKPLIYIERQRGLGDVLWIEPLIRQLAAKYHRVIVFSEYNVLFKNYPLPNVRFKNRLNWVEKIVRKAEKRFRSSFLFIDLENSYEIQPKMHFLHAYQKKAGEPLTWEYPRLYLSDHEKMPFHDLRNPVAILHLDTWSERNYRQVFGIDWSEISGHLLLRGIRIIQIGKQSLNIPGTSYLKLETRELISLIQKSILFIGIDSGPSHLAASLSTPAIIFFGAVNPAFRHFTSLLNGVILQKHCEFAGCYHDVVSLSGPVCRLVGDNGIPKCSVHTNNELISAIDELLDKNNFLISDNINTNNS